MQRNETPAPIYLHLLTGHFKEGADYRTWRSRGTDDYLLIYTLSGCGRFGDRHGSQQRILPGDLVLLPPGTPHDYGVDLRDGNTSWELLWAHFHARPGWQEWLRWPQEESGFMRLRLKEDGTDTDIHERILSRFFAAHHLATGGLKQRELFAMNALEETLLWCDTQNPLSPHSRTDARVRTAMDYLCYHLSDPDLSLDKLAKETGCSVSRLAHLFREQVGTTPQQFLEQERITRAQQLLRLTTRSIQAVAAEVGYRTPFYFSLRFKKQTGFSPREWRTRNDAS